MDTLNSTPSEPAAVPAEAPTASTPETSAPAATAAPVAAVKTELPKTTGTTVGGWNRFAGYNPNAAKSKQKDGRGGSGGRGR